MARRTGRPALVISADEREVLERLRDSRKAPMRVKSQEELKQRIMQGVREMNLNPVVFRWKKFDLTTA